MLKTEFLVRLGQGTKRILRFYKWILNGYTIFKNRNQQQINKIIRRYCFIKSLTCGNLCLIKGRGTPLISSKKHVISNIHNYKQSPEVTTLMTMALSSVKTQDSRLLSPFPQVSWFITHINVPLANAVFVCCR